MSEDPPTVVKCWHRSGAPCCFVDTLNHFPTKLKDLGSELGVAKLEMPGEVASDEDWFAYCERDVEILETVVLQLIRLIEDHNLGNFSYTAAGQAMHAYRHGRCPYEIGLHDLESVRALERDAYYGGRRWVFFQGSVLPPLTFPIWRMAGAPETLPRCDRGPVYHLDLTGAYPSVMHRGSFPTKLSKEERDVTPQVALRRLECYELVGEVLIEDDDEPWPLREGDEVTWRVGRFRTALAGAELARALRTHKVRICYRLQSYSRAPIFTPFVEEFWQAREKYRMEGKPLMSRYFKHLLNSLHGKFAERQHKWEMVASPRPPEPWGQFPLYDADEGRAIVYRAIGSAVQRAGRRLDHPESFPAIAACVTAAARERIRDLRLEAGPCNVLYEDSDSIHVTDEGFSRLKRAGEIQENVLGALRVCQVANLAVYWGPLHYRLDDRYVCSGVKVGDAKEPRGIWAQDEFQRLDSYLQGKPPDGPIVREVERPQPDHRVRGRVARDGWVTPIRRVD